MLLQVLHQLNYLFLLHQLQVPFLLHLLKLLLYHHFQLELYHPLLLVHLMISNLYFLKLHLLSYQFQRHLHLNLFSQFQYLLNQISYLLLLIFHLLLLLMILYPNLRLQLKKIFTIMYQMPQVLHLINQKLLSLRKQLLLF